MGIFWRYAMPLLSTLAALVIIVHSAEEDLEQEYRYDLRPRALNTEPGSYEQPWRVVKAEPAMSHASDNVWSQHSQEQPKRRRKRKRRPEVSDEDNITQERYSYAEPPPKVQDADYENVYHTTDTTRRRRKRINARTNRWGDEAIEAERPIRRNRRKRPPLEPLTKLSEFPEQQDSEETDAYSDERFSRTPNPGYIEYTDPTSKELNPDSVLKDILYKKSDKHDGDISLSEFSMEHSYENPKPNDKVINELSELEQELEIQKNEHYLSPLTLKDILKRSNGSSLSEMLQRHNLTLADLLHGKEKAIKVLKSEDTTVRRKDIGTVAVTESDSGKEQLEIEALESKNPSSLNSKVKENIENTSVTNLPQEIRNIENKETEVNLNQIEKEQENKTNKPIRYMNRHRFPPGLRKKLRLRPMINNTFKSPLSRDMAALGLKRFPNRRNITKSQEWITMIPFLVKAQSNTHKNENDTDIISTTTSMPTTTSMITEDTTIVINFDTSDAEVETDVDDTLSNVNNSYIEISSTDLTEAPVTTSESPTTIVHFNITEKSIIIPIVTQLNASNVRRNAFNRLKKKRLKQKMSTTEAPENKVIKNIFGFGTLASSSDFVARTTTAKQAGLGDDQDFDTLEDFITTVKVRQTESSTRASKATITSIRPSTTTRFSSPWRPTEETAEFEIEELLNDTRTSAKLSKILMERNMTLNELVEHRERGSSHVHLADIFHNASREPNPPEPFLSKSLIEPISKETYPLRALLDANSHDPTIKATTIEPTSLSTSQSSYIQNIPVVMDFGNNVNENAENMGIMSLFNHSNNTSYHVTVHDSENIPHGTNSDNVNNSTVDHMHREGRTLNNNQDMVSWNDIFSMIRKGHHNNETEQTATESYRREISPPSTHKRITLEEDVDGDGVIVLEDLQHLKDFDNNIASDEKIEIFESEGTRRPSVLTIPGNTKSVTVATASIVGLSMVLFLLTYAAFKWIQQKKKEKKRNFPSERIPTPVFENRKGHKNNSSTRSISPMLSSSNIYTMNTLESHHGKDSPEYMWDTLRKPFQ